MKGTLWLGIFLILLGLAALAWPAITYTKTEKIAGVAIVIAASRRA